MSSLPSALLLLLLLLPIRLAAAAGSRGKGAIGSGGKAATNSGGPGVLSGGGRGGYAGGRFAACGGAGDSECGESAAGERLVKRVLLCGYDRTSRPVRNDTTTTSVNVAVSLFHILDTVSSGRALTFRGGRNSSMPAKTSQGVVSER